MKITIEIDEKELKGLGFKEEKEKPKVEYYRVHDLEGRTKATELLQNLEHIGFMYGVATVADYLDMQGKKSNYTANKYGWTYNMIRREAKVVSDYGLNWRVYLPEPIEF